MRIIIKKKIASRLNLVPAFVDSSLAELNTLHLSKDDLFAIKLSLEEAIANAVKHGNKLDPDLCVSVLIEADAGRIFLEVLDEGKGFDVNAVPDPTHPKNLSKHTGRGVLLIKKMMDEVHFSQSGRCIQMIKFIHSR